MKSASKDYFPFDSIRPLQEEALDKIDEAYKTKRFVILEAPTGFGKSFKSNTKILMYDGSIKYVQDIEVGDLVMGDNSTPRKVLTVHGGRETMYKVIPTKGDSYTVNKSHILSLKYTNSGKDKKRDNKKIDIHVEDYLKLSNYDKHRLKGYRAGANFKSKKVNLDPYILGIWLGDGNSDSSIITTPDKEVVDYLNFYFKDTDLEVIKKKAKERCDRYSISSGHGHTAKNKPRKGRNFFLNFLRDRNLLNNKHVPNEYKVNSKKVRLEVLAGLIDSDGYYNGCFEYSSRRKALAEDVAFIARSLGLAAYIKKAKKTCCNNGKVGIYYLVSISGNIEIIPTKIKRKQASLRKQIKDVLVTGVKLRKLRVGNYYGFSTDGNKRFLLGDFTVVHNSPVVMAVARKYGPAHIMTPQKILQSQYMRDFSKDLFVIKGRGNFECDQDLVSCASAPCIVKNQKKCISAINGTVPMHDEGMSFNREEMKELGIPTEEKDTTWDGENLTYDKNLYKMEGCPYKAAVFAAKIHDNTLHNFHSFLYQGLLANVYEKRPILIVDECHNIESIIMDFFHIDISNSLLNDQPFPQFKNIKEIRDYFTKESYGTEINRILGTFNTRMEFTNYSRLEYLKLCKIVNYITNDIAIANQFDRLILKVELLLYYSEDNDFVFEVVKNKLNIKPVYVNFWMKNLFDMGGKVFLTSATILDKKVYCDNLGIPLGEAEFIQMPSEFPKENRKIYIWAKGKLTSKLIDANLPKIIPQVKKITDHYKNDRGIIHTHNFNITRYLQENFKNKRFLYQENYKTRDEMLEEHYRSKNTILVAPALHEGLDLKDDLSRFQIIVKVPYPGIDMQINYRLNQCSDWPWYNWLTALKLIQSYGRSVRHKDDYADTYILDGSFEAIIKNSRFFPVWFTEALKNVKV